MSRPAAEDAPIETQVLDGLALAKSLRGEMAEEIGKLVAAGLRPPCLAVVLAGDDPASRSYVKGKQRACSAIGMDSVEHLLPESTTQDELLELIDQLNANDGVDGILVQLPLPDAISAAAVAERVDPAKDADALHPLTSGRLLAGTAKLVSCTPLGIMAVLDHHEIPIEGAHAVVIGRSNIVGKPISLLLQQRNATVTMCHSRTRDLAGICRQADILVAATGRPCMVKADWVKPGAAVIDVGVTEVDGKLVGDVDFEAVKGIARLITPSRRGIGPMTITMLLRNTLLAYRLRKRV
ncbi:MAG: bifunctional methylenetetrahydrofolate dehydrogenase/methenyltetrahydrofolate cyclohydrolase FolD [Deltaproteobacteria bacterium]|nr:bifunctional methylenetetrahydrofolate dehydrogenase/methenyltetrahydrofolate cyclohydrolase FolD [Deltaproteobacteria bacterium]MBW2386290.1 bifunctional methylenetetrahydrofolate dehydrogenase/methenyltetrahydrofolate cyclohydrolase FolD [Deltaproteobacteria bacterium]MBW2696610.1 bifunctional methylenetetrahydrofolate dehydrogenase/methenyltetrahydrofolate cyclohydrolase FolD [Deltaproteobacteria bacterium]